MSIFNYEFVSFFIYLEYIYLEVIFLDNFNIDANMVNKLKSMMDNGELSDVISKIPPEMMQNFSSMMNNGDNAHKNNGNSSGNNNSGNFDFSNIDMNTIMKMKSVLDKMNSKDDPRTNLLHSLKPYLRDEKKEKIDQYANLMNVAKIAELLKNDGKENNGNGLF